MVKQQAAMTVVSPFIERLKKKLEGYVNENDIDLSTTELTDLVSMAKNEYPVLAENLKKIFEAFKEAGLDTMPETGELSGLQRGIESVSEETAQIIEAYLNAIRMTVVDNGSKMSSVISSLESISNSISNTMVGYLKTVALEATTMRQMFDSIIQTGHPKNGSGIRVFID
jgi:phage-related protein